MVANRSGRAKRNMVACEGGGGGADQHQKTKQQTFMFVDGAYNSLYANFKRPECLDARRDAALDFFKLRPLLFTDLGRADDGLANGVFIDLAAKEVSKRIIVHVLLFSLDGTL